MLEKFVKLPVEFAFAVTLLAMLAAFYLLLTTFGAAVSIAFPFSVVASCALTWPFLRELCAYHRRRAQARAQQNGD